MRKSGTRWHFLVRDMVESFEITVPFVRTDDNVADFFTKPLPAKKFLEMRRILMNEDADPSLTSNGSASVARLGSRRDRRPRGGVAERSL